MMYSKKLRQYLINLIFLFFLRKEQKKQPKISLLIPFSSKNKMRKKTLKWLKEYWKYELPEAEVIIGKSKSKVFCKAEALNDAVSRANGKILVIIDSDAYIKGRIIEKCADKILENPCDKLWFVPYRHLYRLTKEATEEILASNPSDPLKIKCHPPLHQVENNGHKNKYGHRYGAMCMIFPREAFDTLGCFDERFKGWGGEDISLLRALDTLYGKHKTTRNCIFHLWHPYIGADYRSRKWVGQKKANPNGELATKYNRASRHPSKMRKLVDEGCECRK